MSVWTAISTRLSGDSQLIAQLNQGAGSIFYGRQPAHNLMPYLSFWSPGSTLLTYTAPNTTGTPVIEDVGMQLDVFATDPGVANAIAIRVRTLLDFKGQAVIAVDDGILLGCYPQSSVNQVIMEEQPETDVSDVFHVPILYNLRIQKAL